MTPDDYTIREQWIDVGHKHQLYVHDWGNKKAKLPIMYLHGGPGSGCKDKHKAVFNPQTQRVIFHDQRGCGRSLPYGRWHHNNTQELAADITKVADCLGMDKFVLTGGSWGSLLALYYAISQPRRVAALVIDGVWTGAKTENDWLDQGLFRTHFPDVWERYLAETPPEHRENPTAYHFKQVTGNDPVAAAESARIYGNLESGIFALNDRTAPPVDKTPADFDPIPLQIEMCYLAKDCFLPERFILKNAHTLKMPVYMIQGRYDFVCPPATAYALSKLMPNASLTWVVSGHMGEHETATAKQLIYARLCQDEKRSKR